MHKIAQQFATACKPFSNVFSIKQAETDNTFELLLKNVNDSLKLDLQLSDMKRLINLIVMWYANWYNNKLIEKKTIPEAINKYLLMFFYVPKTVKRFYYCEFCTDHFTTEHRYYTHRIKHTGATFPYQCGKCVMGFTRANSLKLHEASCKKPPGGEVPTKFQNSKAYGNKDNTKTVVHRAVKTAYVCAKCSGSFGNESEMNAHLAACFRTLKRQPKLCTPRPKQKVEPYAKK